jgi:hypothetical protein
MTGVEPRLQALIDGVRAAAKERHARWDDDVFDTSNVARFMWQALEKQPVKVRDRSILLYLNLIASAIGAGYLDGGPRRTLMAGLCMWMPRWLATTHPRDHAKIVATAWNLADGTHHEASWMDQYLLARISEFSDPTALEEKALELMKPVLEPQPDAAWKGPYTVTVLNFGGHVEDFLPGELSAVTPGLIRVQDRRNGRKAGVLLASGGKSTCIGAMDGASPDAPSLPAPDISVTWGSDRVTVDGAVIDLPLMACMPLHTLALRNGYLLAAVQNSQRLWVVETP